MNIWACNYDSENAEENTGDRGCRKGQVEEIPDRGLQGRNKGIRRG